MIGKIRHGRPYYTCYPANNNADRLDRYPADHPKIVYVREDRLLEALDAVIATHVFGPDRADHLRRGLAQMPARRQRAETQRAQVLRDQIADLTARQDRLIEELETADPADRTFRDRLRRRFDALETERTNRLSQLHDLEQAPTTQREQAVDLLDALPVLPKLDITQAPERIQRKLYDALQLQIHYDRPDNQARFRLVLTDDTIETLADVISAPRQGTPPGAPSLTSLNYPL